MFEFNTTPFVWSHGRAPKGRGSWAFRVRDLSAEPVFSPSMSFTEAKAWIKNRIRPEVPEGFAGVVVIEVLS
jgi:hypothetical protein